MQLELRGVRTVTIVTDEFVSLAAAQARVRRRSDLAVLVIAHPVGGLRSTELDARVDEVCRTLGRHD